MEVMQIDALATTLVEIDSKPDTMLCNFGAEVKATPEGRLGGYIVRFKDASRPDTWGDYFTAKTEFGLGNIKKCPVYLHHKLPLQGRSGKIVQVKEQIGEGTLSSDEEGILIDAILYENSRYRGAVLKSIGSLGWSSGSVAHLVEKERTGRSRWVKYWPLGLDASLTPTPSDKDNDGMVALKSSIDFDLEPEADTEDGNVVKAGTANTDTITKAPEVAMTQEEMDKAVADKVAAELKAQADAEAKKLADEKAEQEKIDAAVKAALKARKPVNAPALNLKAPQGDDAFKAMRHWIQTGDNGGLRADPQYKSLAPEDLEIKTSYPLIGSTQYQGAEVVPIEVLNKIYEKRDELSIARLAGSEVRTVGTRTVYVPIDINAPAWTVQTNDTTAFTEPQSAPLNKATVTIQTYNRTVQIANSLLEDSVANVEQWWMSFLGRGLAVTENGEFLVGDGSANALGVHVVTTGHTAGVTAASATTLTAAEIVTLYYSLPSQYRDNCAWTMTGATEGIIRGLSEDNFNFINTPSGSVGGYLIAPNARVFNSSSCPAATASLIPIVVGNWNAGYIICEARQMKVFRDPYSRALYDQVCIHASARFGGTVKDVLAFRGLTMASA